VRLLTHTSMETDPATRGRELGRAQGDAVKRNIHFYSRMFSEAADLSERDVLDAGRRVGETLSRYWPELLAEIDGLANAVGHPTDALLAVNARTELLAESPAPECSLLACTPTEGAGGRAILAQNWDWHPDVADSLLVWTVRGSTGEWFTTLTEAGMVAKIGMNCHRLGCGLNRLVSIADGPPADGTVPIHVLLRKVLQTCRSLSDAVRVLRSAEVSASSCITVAFADGLGGAAAAVELAPGSSQVVRPDRRGYLCHTNHFLAPDARPMDTAPIRWPESLTRLSYLYAALDRFPTSLRICDIQSVLSSHTGDPTPICRHLDDREAWTEAWATLSSVVLDLAHGRMWISPGPPCSADYQLAEADQSVRVDFAF
jgi:isopenicillin-N N-acyltransferase like protein